jgi:DNA-binding transcriptional ArsR family regulator
MPVKEILDLVLNPVRMRILVALNERPMSTQELATRLSDVPPATLYRQVKRLAKGGMIKVIEQRQVRGTLEKTYAIQPQELGDPTRELAQLSKDEHMRYFTAFVSILLDDFARYLEHSPQVDLAADGVGYQRLVLNLSDEELQNFSKDLNHVLLPYIEQKPAADRRSRNFSTILVPDPEPSLKTDGHPMEAA